MIYDLRCYEDPVEIIESSDKSKIVSCGYQSSISKGRMRSVSSEGSSNINIPMRSTVSFPVPDITIQNEYNSVSPRCDKFPLSSVSPSSQLDNNLTTPQYLELRTKITKTKEDIEVHIENIQFDILKQFQKQQNELLQRFDKLEQQNKELLDEIKELRDENKSLNERKRKTKKKTSKTQVVD